MKILGCEVLTATLEAWSKIFVDHKEPFFLNPESRALLPNTISRAELKKSLEFSDAYFMYSIPAEASVVVMLEPKEFRSFSRELQSELIALQVRFHRGQIYDLEFVRKVLGEIPGFLEPDIFGEKFVLHFDTWNFFRSEIRFRWLAAYVSIDRESCLSSVMPETTWVQLEKQVRLLAGTFSNSSGANCFATVIAGLTPDLEDSKQISQTWMLEHEFLEALEIRGFRDSGKLELPVKPNSVITWHTSKLIHACLVLEFDLVLNKDAQSWFAPRQILRLESVLKSWEQDASDVRVWTLEHV